MNRKEIYEFIVKYKTENDGLSPSMREIMGQGVSSTSVVDWHLKKLEQEGKISCNGVRGIKVIGGEWRSPMKKYIDRGLFEDYSRHWPWYAKVSRGRNWQRICCKLGKHIPVGATGLLSHEIDEVFCQECVQELTIADWNKFWKGE